MSRTKILWKKYTGETFLSIKEFFSGKIKKQLPNMLTFSRLFAPLVIIPLAIAEKYIATIIATGIFALTDTVDGYFARKWNSVSQFGKDLDAFVDKIFAVTLLIAISFSNLYLLILIFFEFVISVINGIETYKDNKPKTIMIGKFKTIALSFLIMIFMINLYIDIPNYILYIIFVVTLVLQVFTTLGYLDVFLNNSYNKNIKIAPQESNGKVMNKLNKVLLHEDKNKNK